MTNTFAMDLDKIILSRVNEQLIKEENNNYLKLKNKLITFLKLEKLNCT